MFFKKNKIDGEKSDLAKVAALMIYAAKIDENYSKQEEEIIKEALQKIDPNNKDIQDIIKKGKEIEENANQILDFTKEIKNMDENKKVEIIKSLWKIIYSNKDADMYETNLMRRLSGLLYIDSKTMGDIKEEIKKEIT